MKVLSLTFSLFLFISLSLSAYAQDGETCESNVKHTTSFINTETFEKFAIDSLEETPIEGCGEQPLPDRVKTMLDSMDKIEILVRFDHNDPSHWVKTRKGETQREYLSLHRSNYTYWKYLLPTVVLSPEENTKLLALLQDQSPFFIPCKKRPGIHFLRSTYVLRVSTEQGPMLISILDAGQSIGFSIGENYLSGGALHEDTKTAWLALLESAIARQTQEK